jgi:hypothetical protein
LRNDGGFAAWPNPVPVAPLTAVKFGRRFRQAASSFVKFCQAMSSFVKPLLDGAFCNFNGLPETSLTAGPPAGPPAADAASTRRADETRIPRVWAPAKKLSASRR